MIDEVTNCVSKYLTDAVPLTLKLLAVIAPVVTRLLAEMFPCTCSSAPGDIVPIPNPVALLYNVCPLLPSLIAPTVLS